MSRCLKLFYPCLLLALSITSQAAALVYAPEPNLLWNNGVLAPAIVFAKEGLTAEGHLGSASTGGDFTAFRASFPINRSKEPSSSGWSWGVGAGLTQFASEPGVIFSPPTYFWEAVVGRGTTELLSGGESGIRGYFEVGFRDQRSEHTPGLDAILNQTRVPFENHNSSIVVRLGAGNDFEGRGLTEQAPPWVMFRLLTGIYLPVASSKNRVFLTLEGHALIRCLVPGLGCGLGLNILQSSNATAINAVQELYRHATYGPEFEFRWRDRYAAKLLLQWSWIGAGGGTNVVSSAPASDCIFTMAF